jgi:hypothetical protein
MPIDNPNSGLQGATASYMPTHPLPELICTIEYKLVWSFQQEQMDCTIQIMKEDGFWRDPASRYIVRSLLDAKGGESFLEFEIDDGKVERTFVYERHRMRGLSRRGKQDFARRAIESSARSPQFSTPFDVGWESKWLSFRQQRLEVTPTLPPPIAGLRRIGDLYRHALIILLATRSVRREEVSARPVKHQRNAPSAPPRHREIILRCPEQVVRVSDGTRTHASPIVHYRSAHRRNQPHGPGRSLVKQITIEGFWVNASEDDNTEPPILARHYKLISSNG